jgi:hypothetical protein
MNNDANLTTKDPSNYKLILSLLIFFAGTSLLIISKIVILNYNKFGIIFVKTIFCLILSSSLVACSVHFFIIFLCLEVISQFEHFT